MAWCIVKDRDFSFTFYLMLVSIGGLKAVLNPQNLMPER
jgi:hypothetical protein